MSIPLYSTFWEQLSAYFRVHRRLSIKVLCGMGCFRVVNQRKNTEIETTAKTACIAARAVCV